MTDDLIYEEKLSSRRTEALFISLSFLFLLLLIWQLSTGGSGILIGFLLFLFMFFFFYSVNYRVLLIRITGEFLTLKFGVFSWRIPLKNIRDCRRDHLPIWLWYGGAGIHFMLFQGRYRASFNFLEFPRVVIAFRRKSGPVRDVSFSTRHPDELLRILENTVSLGGLDIDLHRDVQPATLMRFPKDG
jgi:hypothetical protein